MSVGENKITALHPVPGIRMASVAAGIKKQERNDVVLFEISQQATIAGIYTKNAFCAAPVILTKKHMSQAKPRYFLINTGNANAGTGEKGIEDALSCCNKVVQLTGVDANTVLTFSTGVIGEFLPVEKIKKVLGEAVKSLNDDAWLEAAMAIMTTDTRPKAVSYQIPYEDRFITITGIAKGAGMLKPNMATMLAYIFTDANIEKNYLQTLLEQFADKSFNRITVDGDTSTNDCCMLVASAASDIEITKSSPVSVEFIVCLERVFVELAKGLIRDAEGASKFITIKVEEGKTSEESLNVAYAVAESPLVKTALFASDPNWGRILAAVGRAGIESLAIQAVEIWLGDVCIVSNGRLDENYSEEMGTEVMAKDEITITIKLGRGNAEEQLWTSDLSYDYVRINAEYRT